MFACRFALIAAGVAALAVAGCGGGERQDADEPSGTFQVAVVNASFPTKQHLAKPERFVIAVRNTGSKTVPNVAVTVDSFAARSEQAGLADPSRAVWIVDASPRGRRHRLHQHVGARAPGPRPDAALRVARDRRAGRHAHGQVARSRPGSTARPRRRSPATARPPGRSRSTSRTSPRRRAWTRRRARSSASQLAARAQVSLQGRRRARRRGGQRASLRADPE